jgi:transposase
VASQRVHSRYERRLLDTAAGGQETLIHLRVRRFFCQNTACAKKTFAEQVPGLTTRYGRRSTGLTAVLRAVALALGGRAGARLAGRLAAAVSRMTLIRLIRALPEPVTARAPAVLGVDDFALRRGHCYGTLLVDVQSRRPVDVLPDRSADSFAAWLAARPGAQFICRDRAGCYADGAARGAPLALQVADRWHLWHNLGDAVERAVARHRQHLSAAVTATASAARAQAEPVPPPAPATPRTGRIADRTRARHADVHRLLAEGGNLCDIAVKLGLSRNTVRRFARVTSPEELLGNDGTGRRPSILDAHAAYLHQQWNSGCTNAALLWQEIRNRRYQGSRRQVRAYLARFRENAVITAPAPVPPKPRAVAGWIMTRPDRIAATDRASLETILASSPELAAVTASVRAFAAIMTERPGRDLEKWMTAAIATGEPALRSFVTGLRADQDAVTAGLTLPYSSGVVGGHVNRIKMLNARCTGAPAPACSAAASSSPTNPPKNDHGNCARASFICRRHQ